MQKGSCSCYTLESLVFLLNLQKKNGLDGSMESAWVDAVSILDSKIGVPCVHVCGFSGSIGWKHMGCVVLLEWIYDSLYTQERFLPHIIVCYLVESGVYITPCRRAASFKARTQFQYKQRSATSHQVSSSVEAFLESSQSSRRMKLSRLSSHCEATSRSPSQPP